MTGEVLSAGTAWIPLPAREKDKQKLMRACVRALSLELICSGI